MAIKTPTYSSLINRRGSTVLHSVAQTDFAKAIHRESGWPPLPANDFVAYL